jgi:CRP/FNR family cyclic AMP-dependent transcriptional regulator
MHQKFIEHRLVQDLSPATKSTIYQLGEVVEVSTDEVIIQADTPNREMYLILEGAFKVNLPDRPGRVAGFTLGYRGPGDLIGEYSFIDSFRPTARVTASTPGLVLRIPHEPLRKLLDQDPLVSSVVYRNILTYLVNRLRTQDEELEYVMV